MIRIGKMQRKEHDHILSSKDSSTISEMLVSIRFNSWSFKCIILTWHVFRARDHVFSIISNSFTVWIICGIAFWIIKFGIPSWWRRNNLNEGLNIFYFIFLIGNKETSINKNNIYKMWTRHFKFSIVIFHHVNYNKQTMTIIQKFRKSEKSHA